MKVFNLRRAMRAALLLLLITAGVTKVFAQAFWDNQSIFQFEIYDIENHLARVKSCSDVTLAQYGVPVSLHVNATVEHWGQTFTVKQISYDAFKDCTHLLRIYLPADLDYIGSSAFENCTNLVEVMHPNSNNLVIDASAFKGCTSLAGFGEYDTFYFPETETIYPSTFLGCTSLQNVVIPASVTSIGATAFYDCSGLENIYVKALQPATLGGNAFNNISATAKIYVPHESVNIYKTAWSAYADLFETMPAEMFLSYTYDEYYFTATVSRCNPGIYGELVIPDEVRHGNDNYTVIAIDNGNPNHGTFELCDGLTKVTFPSGLKRIESGAFQQCSNLTQVDFSACTALTEIGGSAFKSSGLTSVSLPASLTILNNSVFEDCTQLTSVEIPDGLTQIGIKTFYNTNLTSLTLPASVRNIGKTAFYPCYNMTEITAYRATPPTLGQAAFPDYPTITVNVLNGSVSAYQNDNGDFGWGTYNNFTFEEIPTGTLLLYCYDDVNHTATLTGHTQEITGDLEIPASIEHNRATYTVTAIGNNALRNSTNMTSVSFPSTITSIGEGAFFNCTALTSIDLSGCTGMTNVSKSTFLQCTSLESVTLPSGITSIGQCAFQGCPMTEIELPSGLTTIGVSAFASSGLTSIVIPASVTNIGDWAFDSSADLANVYVLNTTPATIGAYTFRWIDEHNLIHVPTSAIADYSNAEYWKDLQLAHGALVFEIDEVNGTANLKRCGANFIGDLVIPETTQGYPVTSINWSAISDQPYVTSISIPASMTFIDFGAIMNCESLQNITITAGNTAYKTDATGALLTMDGKGLIAFPCGKNIASYDIPEGVEQTWRVFDGNKTLQTIYIPRSLRFGTNDFQVENAFYGLDCLTTLTVPSDHPYYQANNGVLLDKNGTHVIYCPKGKAGNYTVPNTVTTIDRAAFKGCKNLTSVSIPNNVSTIEDSAFKDCESLTSVVIPEGIVTNGNKTIQSEVFRNCTSLKSATIPEGITTIGYGAFGNTGLLSLTLPSSVTDISQGFYDCVDLGEITCYAVNPPETDPQYVFDNVPEDIPVYVLAGSVNAYRNADGWSRFTNIQAITTPSLYLVYSYDDDNMTATVIYDNSYTSLTGDLVIPGTVQYNNVNYTVTAIADEVFKNCTGLTSVTTPHTLVNIGASAFESCTGMTSVVIGRNVKTIGSYAFKYCYALVNIDYYAVNCGRLNTTIWYDALASNKNLIIRNSVKSIPDYAFFHLPGLTSVTIPNSTESIGEYAFAGNYQLASFTMGSNVKTIGYYAFRSSGITSIDLLNVETVGEGIFDDCTELQTVTLRNSLSTLKNKMFNGCTSLNNVHIPSGVRIIGHEAFKGCTGLTNLVFDDPFQGQLTTIGEEAFRDCGLTSIDIPSTVTTVETWAFYGNTDLTTVTIGTGMQYMGSNVFYNCTSLETVNYNATHCNTIASSFGSTGNSTKTLHIGNNVNYIPANAFAGLKLASVTIPNGVTVIGEYAFYDCANITEINIPNSVTTIGYAAFAGNQLATITLGSGLTSIGEYAFGTDESEQYLETVTSYNVTPPTIFGNTFNTGDYEYATLYVLGDATVNTYQTAPIWGNFFNIQSLDGYYFTGATNSNWGTAANWSTGEVPTTETNEANVIIMTDATVNINNAFANQLTIMDGAVVTVTSGNKLQIGDGGNASFTAADASALVIEEGGQLWNNVDVEATVEKNIDHYTGSRNGYYFIASPIGEFYSSETDWLDPRDVKNMLFGTYDLYMFDQAQYDAEWQNYKSNFFDLRNGWGYLYAKANDVILQFSGTVKSNAYESQLELVYNDEYIEVPIDPENPEGGYTYEHYPFAGWNLMGNPFACDAYISSMSSGFENLNFYKMNDNGNAVEAVENVSGTSIPACSGIFVKTPDQGTSSMTFVRELDPMMMRPNNGSLQIALSQPVTEPVERAGVSTSSTTFIDNAIVSFNEGSRLEKFVLFQDNARIYIPQSGRDYAIVSAEPCGEMPINFMAPTSGQFTISVRPEAVPVSYLHLIDNLTGADTDLLETPSYTFNAKTTDYESRFKLLFATGSSASSETDSFAFINGMGNLSIFGIEGKATVQIIDMLGHVLSSETFSGSYERKLDVAPGVYMLRLINGSDVKVQKMIVK